MSERTLFNRNGPNSTISAIIMNRYPESLLLICSIPNDARATLPNMTKVTVLGEEIFVRGVNSCFYSVRTEDGKHYYVNERYVK